MYIWRYMSFNEDGMIAAVNTVATGRAFIGGTRKDQFMLLLFMLTFKK